MKRLTLRHSITIWLLILQVVITHQVNATTLQLDYRPHTSQSSMMNNVHNFLRINRLQALKRDPIALKEEPIEEYSESFKLFSDAIESANVGLDLGVNPYQFVLEPRHETNLYAEINYPIKTIHKRMSDRFEKGELLIQLVDTVVQGNYNKALAQLQKSEAELNATQELFQDKLASLFELKNAESEVAKAQAELALALNNVKATQIFAPYPGTVDKLYYEEHELPTAGKELIKIIDDDVVIARFLIPSSMLTKIAKGTAITLHISELNIAIKAAITRIGAMIDPSSSTVKVEAEIDNSNKRLKSGMTGIATFNGGRN